jgi:branched-chain amino acid transport system permease protein
MGALFFMTVIRVLSRNNIGEVYMTLSTLAFQIFMVQTLYVYAFWIRETLWVWSYGFLFEADDFQFLGLQGVFPVSLVACILTVAGLRRLMRTKTGIAMRASAENQELAEVTGIDTSKMRSLTWFLSGGLASLAGAMFPMMFQGAPHIGSTIISTIMAASILGGLGHILGAVVGGFIIGFTRIILPGVIEPFFHDSAVAYTIVLIVLSNACVFLLEPRGIMGVYNRVAESRKYRQIS